MVFMLLLLFLLYHCSSISFSVIPFHLSLSSSPFGIRVLSPHALYISKSYGESFHMLFHFFSTTYLLTVIHVHNSDSTANTFMWLQNSYLYFLRFFKSITRGGNICLVTLLLVFSHRPQYKNRGRHFDIFHPFL